MTIYIIEKRKNKKNKIKNIFIDIQLYLKCYPNLNAVLSTYCLISSQLALRFIIVINIIIVCRFSTVSLVNNVNYIMIYNSYVKKSLGIT